MFSLKAKGEAIYSTDIIDKTEKFEKKVIVKLHKAQKETNVHTKITLDEFIIVVDGHMFNLKKEWHNAIKDVVITKEDIVKEFISKARFILRDFDQNQKDFLNSLQNDNLDIMKSEEEKLKLKIKEAKAVKPDEKYIKSLAIAKAELEDLVRENERLKAEWLVSYNVKQKELKDKFDKELEAITKKVNDVVQETKDLYVLKKEAIIASNLPWFKDKDYKKPEVVFDKKKTALQKHFSNINKSLEAETERIIKDNEMLKDTVAGNKFRKRTLKEYLVREKVFEVLEEAGLTKAHAFRYPHEFSGGMRQRVGIARAIVSQPDIIVADEPIAALDLSIQAQIANLLKSMQEKRKMSMIFIAHDLSMVKHISDRILIIHLGRIVESGTTEEIFDHPVHPYTKNLIRSMPDIARISKGFENNNFEGKYLKGYTIINQPEYITIDGTHKVLATKEQFKEWQN